MRAYRQFLIALVIGCLLLLLTGRLLWLQSRASLDVWLGEGGTAQQAVRQRRAAVVIDDGRGRIVDRTGLPLAGYPIDALLVTERPNDEGNTGKLLSALAIERSEWKAFLAAESLPALWRRKDEREPEALTASQVEQLRRLELAGITIVPYVRRYLERPLAAQLIGYVGENPELIERQYASQITDGRIGRNSRIGAAGLERSFDRFLQPNDPVRWAIYRDGGSKPLPGIRDRLLHADNAFYPLTLRTTIDRGLQAKVEQLLSRYPLKEAAVVVLAAASGDVLAMAGLPAFDPYCIDPELGTWRNRAVSAYAPGSIFKTVVAAAALEAGLTHPGEVFECTGEWREHHLRCVNRGGHGRITLEQAYAQSCNLTFAQLAARIGPQRLEAMAVRLGIGSPVGWAQPSVQTPIGVVGPFHQFDNEQAGQLFDPAANRLDQGALARTGIGQQDVRMTPLQAARLTAVIVNGGKSVTPRVASEMLTERGRVFYSFTNDRSGQNGQRLLSGRTAAWLAEAMRLTARIGTARKLAAVKGGAGGKTGTAEEGSGQARRVHQWFTGFAPAHAPKYAFTVLLPDRDPDSAHLATTIAQQLVQLLGDG